MDENSETNIVVTEKSETSENADELALVRYLHENHLALCVRGSTSRFAEDYRTNGSNPEFYGTRGYSYWTVFSPALNPELLDSEHASKIKNEIKLLVEWATSYTQGGDEPLILTTFLPVTELTQNQIQQGTPFDETNIKFKRWQKGASSLNVGKGNHGFPGFRTCKTISPEKLNIYLGKPGSFMISVILASRAF